MNPFLRENGTTFPYASINQVIVVSLEGVSIDETSKNKAGWELVSSAIFNKQVDDLVNELPDQNTNGTRFDTFISCLTHENDAIKQKAHHIMRQMGRKLGYILLTLQTGHPANRAARKDWSDEHWRFWHDVKTVYLCGGLTYKQIGVFLKKYMETFFDEAGIHPYEIAIPDNSHILSLIGDIRLAGRLRGSGLGFDFGHTLIKRGYCTAAAPGHPQLLPSVPSSGSVGAAEMNQALLQTITDTYKELLSQGIVPEDTVVVSIASYVNEGVFLSDRGIYGQLAAIAPNYEQYLCEALSTRLSKPITVKLLHDGTAAAMALDPLGPSAVISLGTTLGVGFPGSHLHSLTQTKF